MSSESHTCTVEELVASGILAPPLDGNHGAIHPKASDFVPSGIPFIMASDMHDGRVDTTNCAFISQKQASSLRKGFSKSGDVLLSHKATIGRTALVGDMGYPYLVLTPQVTYYRVLKPTLLNNRFLKYYFDSQPFQETLAAWAGSGSTRAYLGITAQRKLPITLPPISTQKAIAETVGALDDRIALLRETNATLEAIAQALFKSWFVDFDPVHAKQLGRIPEGAVQGSTSAAQGRMPLAALDEATAALFPDSFEESVLGLVPRGWRAAPIGDVVEIVGGGTPDTKEPSFWEPAEHCWTTPKDLSGIHSPILLSTDRKLSTKGLAKVSSGLLPTGTLLMSSRAPIGYLAIAQVPLAINQGYIAILPASELPPLFMLYWCRQNMDNIKGRANGSTFMEISKKAFRPIPAVVPNSKVIKAFVDVVGALFERLVENEKQAQTLATLRDTLLPRLISGQLRLPEAEAMLETV
ncbi:restriction endonuclease subunit S [Methylomonas methanica]|uniref:Restriction modification system DNA specificity domain protein n=1 Tax=Methylomonas methanica (strain DSM 25384 / MC09) TaxID=857087 RepID=G0A548_METMM|nr:restriction endonuclease subunit S [Methylomonas methanica]AEG00378.1 restriction modification system DNA specificity domain protein [Methylomonas methanica MC09]